MRKAAAAKPYRVWSYWQGAWWMVDHGDDPTLMVASARRRQSYVLGKGTNPDARFVATEPGQLPEEVAFP